ncbi:MULTISPECIES: GAF domain-containing protein [unclassified Streptomyces]|uniref:GAF domain-containing protein n=1 Tax=unclassified Streptomyces TaxID=2593676 RepID=UPI0036E590D3
MTHPSPTSSPAPFTAQARQLQVQAVTDDPAGELAQMATRVTRLAELGIPLRGSEILDDLASEMAARSGFVYAMVNAFSDQQTFLGLHNPPPEAGYPIVGRTMSRAHGWCPEVIQRRRGLPLPDVAAAPRFHSNPVVDAIGIQSYFGTPLLDPASGLALLTVCIVDPEPRTLADATRLQTIVRDTAHTAAGLLNLPTPPAA